MIKLLYHTKQIFDFSVLLIKLRLKYKQILSESTTISIQPEFACLKLAIETLEQGVTHVQS